MAVSLQARLSVLIVKWRVKRRLKGVRDYRVARQILRPDPYKVPPTVQISPAHLGGVPGERLEGPTPCDTVLLYLHGGGYFGCSAETHRPITAYYALHGYHVFAPDYRLAPENRFPAAVDDAVAFYRALLSAACPSECIVVAGESAGGGLTLSLMLALRSAGDPLPAAAALFSPWTDLAATAIPFEPTAIAALCSTGSMSRLRRTTISATLIRATRSRLLFPPISSAFRRF